MYLLLYFLVIGLCFFFFISVFAVFKLAGWPTRATIARGSQWVPKDSATISLSNIRLGQLRLSDNVTGTEGSHFF